MQDCPYSQFAKDKLILRDELAIDRTILANERTLLAFLRSGVTLMIAGVTIMHFSQADWFWAIGVASLPVGLATGLIGVARYGRLNRAVSSLRKACSDSGERRT